MTELEHAFGASFGERPFSLVLGEQQRIHQERGVRQWVPRASTAVQKFPAKGPGFRIEAPELAWTTKGCKAIAVWAIWGVLLTYYFAYFWVPGNGVRLSA